MIEFLHGLFVIVLYICGIGLLSYIAVFLFAAVAALLKGLKERGWWRDD